MQQEVDLGAQALRSGSPRRWSESGAYGFYTRDHARTARASHLYSMCAKEWPADYDGDGKTALAVYRDGVWYLLQSANGFTAFQWGIASDVPVPADYDGDGKTDAAIYRNGQWWLRQSTNGIAFQQFGLAGDKPIQAAYLP